MLTRTWWLSASWAALCAPLVAQVPEPNHVLVVTRDPAESAGRLWSVPAPPQGGTPVEISAAGLPIYTNATLNEVVWDPVANSLITFESVADELHAYLQMFDATSDTYPIVVDQLFSLGLAAGWQAVDAHRGSDGGILLLLSGPPQCPDSRTFRLFRVAVCANGLTGEPGAGAAYEIPFVGPGGLCPPKDGPIAYLSCAYRPDGKVYLGSWLPGSGAEIAAWEHGTMLGGSLSPGTTSLVGRIVPRAMAFGFSENLYFAGTKLTLGSDRGNYYALQPDHAVTIVQGNTCHDMDESADGGHLVMAFNRPTAPRGRLRSMQTLLGNPSVLADFDDEIVSITPVYTDSHYGCPSPTPSGNLLRVVPQGDPFAGSTWSVEIRGGPAGAAGRLEFGDDHLSSAFGSLPTLIGSTGCVLLQNGSFGSFPFTLDASGEATLMLPVPANTQGLVLYSQAFVFASATLAGSSSGLRSVVL